MRAEAALVTHCQPRPALPGVGACPTWWGLSQSDRLGKDVLLPGLSSADVLAVLSQPLVCLCRGALQGGVLQARRCTLGSPGSVEARCQNRVWPLGRGLGWPVVNLLLRFLRRSSRWSSLSLGVPYSTQARDLRRDRVLPPRRKAEGVGAGGVSASRSNGVARRAARRPFGGYGAVCSGLPSVDQKRTLTGCVLSARRACTPE